MFNTMKTGFLLIILTVLLVMAGSYFGGSGGAAFAFIFALIMNFGSYWFSDKIVLKMYKAQPLDYNTAPQIHQAVSELSRNAGIPKPVIYVVPGENQPNAFATGRNPEHAAVCVTRGILNILDMSELKGVLGHEIGHIAHRDTLIQTVAASIAGAITLIAHFAQYAMIFGGFGGRDDDDGPGILGLLFFVIVGPLAAMIIQMAISRSREFAADRAGAEYAHNPEGLASALEKLEYSSKRIPSDANPVTSHMFIVNPLKGGGIQSLFSTHPPTAERIRRLREMQV